jgi:hypothetical protein
VAATYAIARRIGRPAVGVAAAWIVATSPTLLFMTTAPMSDVPAAAAWSVAIACVLGETTASAAAAGAAAAVAILIRPNLVPLLGVIVLWLLWRRSRRAIVFAAVAALGAAGVAAIDARLYGSPFRTGYDLTDGFALSYVPINLQHYVGWLMSAETPLALAGLACLALTSRALWQTPAALRARSLFFGSAVVVWAIYLLYVPWDAWWYLRFLLPIWPLIAIGTATLVARIVQVGQLRPAKVAVAARPGYAPFRHFGPSRAVAGAAIIGLLGLHGAWEAVRRETFNVARGEAKYVEVARVVESIADPDAVIICAQHSGSIRYYAGRLTLRWDVGDVAWLDRTVDWLAANGHHPYFVLEPQEIAALRARYGPSNAAARLDWTPLVVFRGGAVTMYDAVRRERTGAPVAQPELRAIRECLPQRPAPRLR